MTRKCFRRPGFVPLTSFLVVAAAVQSAACNNEPAEDPTYTREKLMDPLTCKKCHEKHYDEWSGSMHAYASVDPVFRAMNARGQHETEKTLGPFCVNCHAPLAVQEKATTDGTNIADVPDKFQGVTCYFCHQVTGSHEEHNNQLDLANDTTMRGGYDNPTKNEAHHSAYSPLHDSNSIESSKLCGPCHDISVPAHFSGATKDVALERTYAEWQSSLFKTGKTGQSSCGGCHFDPETSVPIAVYPGVGNRPVRHLHDFPGVDVALTDFPNKKEQMDAVLAKLATSLGVTVCISPPGTTGSAVSIRLENVAIGHNMPSGASQDRRLWVEVHLYDNAPGQPEHETFTRGVVPAGTPVVDLLQTEPDLMLFRDEGLNKNGNPAHMFWDIASIKPQPAEPTEGTGGTIGVPITNDPFLGHKNHDVRVKLYKVPYGATRVPVTIHMQPMGLDVLDDLVASGDLDPAIRDAMPTMDFLPNAGVTATVDWTLEGSSLGNDTWNCMGTTQ